MGPRQRGSVLILVLWTLSLFAVYAVTLGVGVRARASLLSRTQTMVALEAMAYSGIERAKATVIGDETPDLDTSTDSWAGGTKFVDMEVGEGKVNVGPPGRPGAVDEESKVNLNKAAPAVIRKLLVTIEAFEDEDEAEQVAYNVVDWRDQDSNYGHPQFGAENDHYEDLERPYLCKDAPLETLDELLLIKGINREIFDKMIPFVTLHGTGAVNINTAPRECLLALGLSERTVEKIMEFRSGTDQKNGTADDAAFIQNQVIVHTLDKEYSLDNEARVKLADLILSEKITTVSSFFSARSRAVARNGAALEIEAVFDRAGKVHSVRSSGAKWPSKA